MTLVFGGAYQGKLAYVLERFNLTEEDVYRCGADDVSAPGRQKVVYGIDQWILALVKAELDVAAPVQRLIEQNADGIVICTDISCGVVPIDETLRTWREAVGRSLAALSLASDEVIRLYCGIPARLK